MCPSLVMSLLIISQVVVKFLFSIIAIFSLVNCKPSVVYT